MITRILSQQMRAKRGLRFRQTESWPGHSKWNNSHLGVAEASVFFLLLLLGISPAAARPQDEVLSGVFKCAPIGDLRTWLDCYYGAAQPQRAALGMLPAPAAQTRLVASPPSGNPSAQDIALRDDISRSALECNHTATGRDWLNCFYAAAEPARTRLGLAIPAGTTANRETLATPAVSTSAFGLRPKPEKTAKSVSARMVAYKFDRDHLFTATLDNGQVWEQIEGDDRIADWNKPASDYSIVIRRGMFGSYNFQVLKSGALFKVRRIL